MVETNHASKDAVSALANIGSKTEWELNTMPNRSVKDSASKARLCESAPPSEEKNAVRSSLSCQSNRGLLNQLVRPLSEQMTYLDVK